MLPFLRLKCWCHFCVQHSVQQFQGYFLQDSCSRSQGLSSYPSLTLKSLVPGQLHCVCFPLDFLLFVLLLNSCKHRAGSLPPQTNLGDIELLYELFVKPLKEKVCHNPSYTIEVCDTTVYFSSFLLQSILDGNLRKEGLFLLRLCMSKGHHGRKAKMC